MRYRWDTKLLYKLWKNPKARKDLRDLYISLWDVFNIVDTPKKSKIATTCDDYLFSKNYNFIFEDINNLTSFEEIEDAVHEYKKQLSKDDILTITHDFYKTTSKEIYKLFLMSYNQRDTHFQFNPTIKKVFYCGHTYVSHSTQDIFLSSNYENNLSCALTTVHEFGHAINYRLNPLNSFMEPKWIYEEIASIFFELIFEDYTEKLENFKEDSLFEKRSFYITLLNDLEIIKNKIQMTEIFTNIYENPEIPDMSYRALFKKYQEDLNLSPEEFASAMRCPAIDLIPYIIGPLIALELYSVFQNDQDKAFYLLRQIAFIYGNSEKEVYEKIKKLGITPTENINNFGKSLKC